MNSRCAGQINIPENTTIIDHILILKPCSITEFDHLYCQQVLLSLLMKQICNIKGMRIIAVLTVSGLHTIDIKVICRFYTTQGNIYLSIFLKHCIIHSKFFTIKSYRIF